VYGILADRINSYTRENVAALRTHRVRGVDPSGPLIDFGSDVPKGPTEHG
jgi:hypothetical protein